MKRLLYLLLLLIPLLLNAPSLSAQTWEADYASLLKSYAAPEGVRYAAWKKNPGDLQRLKQITEAIAAKKLDQLSPKARLAFLLNAYNAWTLHNALEKYPKRPGYRPHVRLLHRRSH
jgi:hypothetical protein